MDIIDALRAFVATAQAGSFTAGAEQLGVSNRLTSKYVAELEARLGTRLLQRTTRRVGLTPAGADLLARAPALLDDLDDLLAEVTEGSGGLSGVIRISAPVTFGEAYVGPMLGRFGQRHPGLTFDLRLDDRFVDLASDGIDLAFRIGRTQMLSVKARRLGRMKTMVVASPGYVAAHGAPEHPQALAEHPCILDTNRRTPARWQFLGEGQSEEVTVAGRYRVNSARAAVELARAGLGIAYVPQFALGAALAEGALHPLLEEYEGDGGALNVVYLEGRALPRKLRALIDFALEDIRQADVL